MNNVVANVLLTPHVVKKIPFSCQVSTILVRYGFYSSRCNSFTAGYISYS